MDIRFTDEEQAFRGEIQAFLREELPDDWDPLDQLSLFSPERLPFTKEMSKKLAARGWLTLAWPREYDGQARPIMEQLVYTEEMSYWGAPGTDLGVGAIRWVGPAIMIAGTEEQKREHLPPIANAERYWCTLYSEPGSGSDLASLQTSAVLDGDEYVVNGQKTWTTAAHIADWGWLAARTDPDAPKHRGISLLMLDMKSPGVSVRPIVNMMGEHEFNEVFFEDVRVPKGNLVGEENLGWYTLALALDFERSGVANSASARRTLETLTKYAQETHHNGKTLAEDPIVRHKLANRHVEAEVARWLAYRVGWMQSQGLAPNAEASMSKLYGTELMQRVAQTGMELMGLAGQLSPGSRWAPLQGHIQRTYVGSVSTTIAAGTSEIQRDIIARRGLDLPRG